MKNQPQITVKMKNEKKYLTVKEVKERFKISRQTLDRAAEAGKISKLKISDGRKVLFIESELEALFSGVVVNK